jgi:nucleotide-binding universal stress UspA family protein
MNKTAKGREKMIPQIKKILYATDLSKNSAYAFYFAVDLAKKYAAEIILLNVIEPIPVRTYGSQTDKLHHGQQEISLEVIRNRLQRFCEKVEEKSSLACVALVSKILVQTGYPVEEILKAANEERCDLIVLGNHGKGFLQQTFLGSVSRSVLDRTRKPVFIIPLPSEKTSVWDEM